MKKLIKKNYKFILGIVIGLIWSSGIAYAATILFDSDEVSYDNTTSGLSATNVQSALDELYVESTSYQLFETRVTKLENLYSVGSIYISTTISSKDDVEDMFGGTWEAIGQGRVLIGAGTNGTYTFEAGSTGGSTVAGNSSSEAQTITNPKGEYTHKLAVAELAKHNHCVSNRSNGGGATVSLSVANADAHGDRNYWNFNSPSGWSSDTGNDYYHNNIQPYLVVYMYKRTA